MKISNKQKAGIEKITGKPWNSWQPETLESYFAFTDRGERTELFNRVWRLQLPHNQFNAIEQELWDLMQYHTFHPVTVEMWKEDFLPTNDFPPLLFLCDFTDPEIDYEKWKEKGYPKEKPTFMYPDAYIKHAFDVYKEVRGDIPIDEISGYKELEKKLEVELGI